VCAYLRLDSIYDGCEGEKDFKCFDGECIQDGRCDGEVDCEHGEDEYWCNAKEPFSARFYRDRAIMEVPEKLLLLPIYPQNNFPEINLQNEKPAKVTVKLSNGFMRHPKTTGSGLRQSIYTFMDNWLPDDYITFEEHYLPFICNRGLAVMDENEETKCLCPPSFYGNQCEFYSDRITV
ncbi:unnamed protein product, partial [Rotaria sp. Silwood2]